MNNERFINFGFNKVIITSSIINSAEYSFHHNVLITNNTTFDEYYNQVIDYIDSHYDSEDNSYGIEIIPAFKVKVWNMDNYLNKKIKINKNNTIQISQKRNYSTKNNILKLIQKRYYSSTAKINSNISPIKNNIVTGIANPISAMDIETIEFNDNQYPVAITLSYIDNGYQIKNELFLIDFDLLLIDTDKALNNLWYDYITYITNNSIKYIFVHNLGNFDGYFIYKGLSEQMEPKFVNTIIDNHNRFITIQMKNKINQIKWLDSYRIFAVTLNELCEVFNVDGKLCKYNPSFNNLDTLLNDEKLFTQFKQYAIQDSKALLKALLSAQDIYLRDFNIDITSIVSTSSLSLKIFRTKFLNVDIPILKGSTDKFIRNSYFGGGCDYYKGYGQNLYYYDVNSLYPFSMMKPMPFKLIKQHNNLNLDLTVDNKLFGFLKLNVLYLIVGDLCYLLNFKGKLFTLLVNGKGLISLKKWKRY
uniref:DNA-directed DNA polymerase n=1 Tax=Tricholoma terreum TaxID=76328 RepID=A0A6C0W525_9AGAR|nr:DNA polymerase 2 [Tricholoma terreum]QIC20230.1 DNA polymerase 2 [Tricholoma terreum]